MWKMPSVAVFVDAGYLFAQGSAAITGSQKPRAILKLNETAAVAELTNAARARTGNLPLLRIYWYDAARGNTGMTLDHAALAHTDYVKLRLGFINSQKQQKGVDPLIVTDLIELARNHAMSDAVLLSGDGDVRIGLQIAQSFGVRVHLIGIAPSRGSQSPQLMQEADTTTEWDSNIVSKFLTVLPSALTAPTSPPTTTSAENSAPVAEASFEAVVKQLLTELDSGEIADLRSFWESNTGLPREVDGRLLARCRTEMGRSLEREEKRYVRAKFIEAVGVT